MKIKLTKKEKIKLLQSLFYDGLMTLKWHSLALVYYADNYSFVAKTIPKEKRRYEDVLIGMLKGGFPMALYNIETEEFISQIDFELLFKGMEKIPVRTVLAIFDENFDANDYDIAWQYILFGRKMNNF